MNWTDDYVQAVIRDLTEENPLACRALFRVSALRFTDTVPTLAVSLSKKPQLMINRDFLNKNVTSDTDLKCLLMHEFLHILLLHTEKYELNSPLLNIALDAIINALIHRNMGPEYSQFFKKLYRPVGLECLLRPMEDSDWEPMVETLLRFRLQGIHTKIYKGEFAAEDLYELLEYLSSRGMIAKTLTMILIGNHEPGEKTDPGVNKILNEILEKMNGSGIWRKARIRGTSDQKELARMEYEKFAQARWDRACLRALQRCMLPDPGGKKIPVESGYVMPVLSTRDRRAALRSIWSELIPMSAHVQQRKIPAESVNVYLDVSGSMNAEIAVIIRLLYRFRADIRRPMWAFSNLVSPARFKDGGLVCENSGGTSISCVLEHIREHKSPKNLIVTDGYTERISAGMLRGINVPGIFALVSAGGNPEVFYHAGIHYIQLEELP